MQNVVGAAVALCLLVIPAAHAGTIRQTLEEFGFMGTWAQDCERPADRENVWRAVTPTRSGARFTESLGEGFRSSSYQVLAVKRLSSDSIVLSIVLNGVIRQDLTMIRRGNRIRTMTNQPEGSSEPVVKDGLVVGTEMATPWLTHCEKQRLRAAAHSQRQGT